jgi:hypothetical protein
MRVKTAAILAFLGMLLATVLLIWNLVSDVLNAAQGLIPITKLFSSAIYSFAALTLAIFFYIFQKEQR